MCEGCPEEEEVELVPLRFIGGRGKRGIMRGPYHSYDTGEIYMMKPENALVPYWELVDGEAAEEAKNVAEGALYSDKEVPPIQSRGLTRPFNAVGPPSDDDFILGMDKDALKYFIEGNGGKVDGRWGWARLVEEARKLQ